MPRFLALLFVLFLCSSCATVTPTAQPPTEPLLRIEAGAHTAMIRRVASDAAGRLAVTASEDKTARLYEIATGRLLRTFRPPVGKGYEGKLYAVALSPDGGTLAVGGWTQFNNGSGSKAADGFTIYLFDAGNGRLLRRIAGLPDSIVHLAFSPDGRHLVAALAGRNGIRIFRAADGGEARRDADYGGTSYFVHFAADGRLLTTSVDGYLRLYDRAFRRLERVKAPGGILPTAARFSPDGARIAVGYAGTTRVDVLSGESLAPLFAADTAGVEGGELAIVAWSADGRTLYAGGRYDKLGQCSVRRWRDGGRGKGEDLTVGATNKLMDLVPLPGGDLLFAAEVPVLGVLAADGSARLLAAPPVADYRDNLEGFCLAADGSMVRFDYGPFGKSPARFSTASRELLPGDGDGNTLTPPRTAAPGLEVTGWKNTPVPLLNGSLLPLLMNEVSNSLAVAPDGASFVLGTEWYLRRFGKNGRELWQRPAPGAVRGVNIPQNGGVVVAAYADGTIRWHRLTDGEELLAFFPHADKKRWVLWTPEGFFDHSPGGEELIGYHLNRGKDQAAEFIPVSKLYSTFYRPDLVDAAFEGKDLAEYAKAVDINKLLTTKTLAPKVRFLTQASQTEKPEQEISAEICDNGGGIGDVTLYLNNMPIAMASSGRGITLVAKGGNGQCASFSRTLTLDNGDNVISLMAYNRDNTIESDRDSVTIKHTSSFTGKPNLHILTIAVDKYRDGDLQLKYSTADANGVAALLQSKGKGLFGTITRHTLADGEVTKEKLEETFGTIGKTIRREDMFILFVAGHGITYGKDGAFYFLPVNFRYSQDDDIPKFGVSMNDFKRYLANIQASKSLLLLDTCNSGSFSEAIASRGILEKTAINKLTRAVGRHTIVASSKSQVAMEGFEGHGAFSWTLLDGMQGKAANAKGQITVNSLVAYVESALPELTYKKWGYEQIPQKSLVGEDFQIGVR